MDQLNHLDEIAREAWGGNYDRAGVLSTGERLYVALSSGRMRELAPDDSIAYAVDRVGPEWMAHMVGVWRGTSQPQAIPAPVPVINEEWLATAIEAAEEGLVETRKHLSTDKKAQLIVAAYQLISAEQAR